MRIKFIGEVIPFPKQSSGSENSKRVKKDLLGKEDAIDLAFFFKLTDTLQFLTALKKSDPHSYNVKNIDERRRALRGQSASPEALEQTLKQIITDGNEIAWRKDPSWYHAAIAELRERGLA